MRVIDDTGENIGVLNTREAIERAQEVGLNLVEVSPNADPPVCKFLDVGKHRYEAQKKANLARKTQKTQEIKEINNDWEQVAPIGRRERKNSDNWAENVQVNLQNDIKKELEKYVETINIFTDVAAGRTERALSAKSQLYTAIAMWLLAAFCYWYYRRVRRFDGEAFWVFGILYAIARFVIELFRADQRGEYFGLSTSQGIGVLLTVTSVAMLVRLYRAAVRNPEARVPGRWSKTPDAP